MRLRKTTTLAAGLLAMTALLGVSGMTRADRVDDYLKAEMTKRHIPGLSVAVVQDGKIVKEQGYGLENVELSALTLTRTAPDGSALYRAVYGRTVVDWPITVDKNHKITGLRPLPE